uniref:Putative E3 ubiquitin-protein ligase UBR7 n=1 Tax=Phallusia mammillata TaxID=59560 RepID=A0A6F9DVK5_9ASCI|nr:putative E3 ubiquitin-protein ligase UBR7 [Phallusia mammillata]
MSQKRKIDEVDGAEEDSVSLQDVIDHDNEMQETANAVLGGSDDKACTYPKGYVSRQALYACSTCTKTDDPPAGICLACSLQCHKDHDLYELYTKRNFRCDCGNSKFPNLTCELCPDKESGNEKNSYNQNFKGKYCTCHRPYPDEEDTVDDEMIQCVICEDWYHSRHLGETAPPNDGEYEEMVCFDCTKRCTFLHKYRSVFVAPKEFEILPHKPINVDDILNEKDNDDYVEMFVGGSASGEGSSKASGIMQGCKVKHARSIVVKGATFWPSRWRSVLCECEKCKKEYDNLAVSFILDETDTVKAYEDLGRSDIDVIGGDAGDLLKDLPHVQKIEMLQSYNEMKGELQEYLEKFVKEGRVVTANDINSFFQNLSSKRQKFTIPHACR